MLKVLSKDYEIEEKVQFTKKDNDGEKILYEFEMKLTENELQELRHILFDFAEENKNKYAIANELERFNLEEQAGKDIISNDERFIDICFKEHKNCKEIVGEYKFYEMIDMIRDYLYDFFIKKQMSPVNSTITNLMKITDSLQKFK